MSPAPLPKEVRAIAIVVIVGAIMSILDTTIVNVALQTLREDLHTSLSTIQWVSTGYLLALAAVIPLTGWAAERFGPRRVWMSVVAGFVATSALCGLAWSAESLIAFRVLQGFAGGMVMPIGMITLAQAAGPQRMARVMSIVGVPMLLGPMLGPVIGGLIVNSVSWRWIFFVNLPIGLVGLALAARLLPTERAAGRARAAGEPLRLDTVGLALLSPGVALIVFGLTEMGTHGGLNTASAFVPIPLGLLLVALFVVHALRTEQPLVDVRLFRGVGFGAAAATTFLVGVALFGALILLPLYYQIARGENPLHAGLLMAPQGIGAALGIAVGGRVADRVGAGRVVIVGIGLLLLGTLPFALVGEHTPYALLVAGLVVRGLGLGSTMMPAMAAAYATLDRSAVPRATPMLNVLQRVGGSLGSATMAVILQHRLAAERASGGTVAHGFATTYRWAMAATALALVPAIVLARAERHARVRARSGLPAEDAVAVGTSASTGPHVERDEPEPAVA